MNGAPYVPIEDVAKHFTVTISCIRGWVRQGKIPKHTYIKLGNTYRFNIPLVVSALTQMPKEETVPVVTETADVAVPVQLELNFNPDEDL
jgi:hypothetical protein